MGKEVDSSKDGGKKIEIKDIEQLENAI